MTGHNPMQSLLRRHLGVDAFALDGDDTEMNASWADDARPREGVRMVARPDLGDPAEWAAVGGPTQLLRRK